MPCEACLVGKFVYENGDDVCANCGMVRRRLSFEKRENETDDEWIEGGEYLEDRNIPGARNVKQATLLLTKMIERLNLNRRCLTLALSYYKQLRTNAKCGSRGRRLDVFLAACLYVSSSLLNCSRTYKDYSRELGIASSNLYRTINVIKKELKVGPAPPEELRPKILQHLGKMGVDRKIASAMSADIHQLFEKTKECDIDFKWGNPNGILGAIVLIVSRSRGLTLTVRKVAEVVGVSGQTIQQRLLEFYEDAKSKALVGDEYSEEPDLSVWLRAVLESPSVKLHSRKFIKNAKMDRDGLPTEKNAVDSSINCKEEFDSGGTNRTEESSWEDTNDDDLSDVNVDEYILGKSEVVEKKRQMKKAYSEVDEILRTRRLKRERLERKRLLSQSRLDAKNSCKKSNLVNYDALETLNKMSKDFAP